MKIILNFIIPSILCNFLFSYIAQSGTSSVKVNIIHSKDYYNEKNIHIDVEINKKYHRMNTTENFDK